MTASIPSVTATEKANEGRLVSAEPLRKNLSSSTNNCDTVHKKFRYRSSVSLHHAQYNLPNNAVPAREKLAKKPGQNYLGHKIELSRFSASRFVSKYYVPGEGWGPRKRLILVFTNPPMTSSLMNAAMPCCSGNTMILKAAPSGLTATTQPPVGQVPRP